MITYLINELIDLIDVSKQPQPNPIHNIKIGDEYKQMLVSYDTNGYYILFNVYIDDIVRRENGELLYYVIEDEVNCEVVPESWLVEVI